MVFFQLIDHESVEMAFVLRMKGSYFGEFLMQLLCKLKTNAISKFYGQLMEKRPFI